MIHKRKLRDVQSAIRTQHTKPYAPNITMRNAKKDAMLERKSKLLLIHLFHFNRTIY